MAKVDMQTLLEKYGDIVKEEINVKEIKKFEWAGTIKKTYKPVGSKISAKFAKDTGNIIRFWKEGNIQTLDEGKIKIFDGAGNEWILDQEDYEVAYEGLEGDNVAVDGDVIAKLDLEITPELKKEGVAREISRFLNQMRKDADYPVDAKLHLFYRWTDDYIRDILKKFTSMFKKEALLLDVQEQENAQGDITALFSYEEKNANFTLKK